MRGGELRGSMRWFLKRRGIDAGKGAFDPEGRIRLGGLRL